MKETKIIKILNALTPEELKDFGKFVNSPYHNTSEEVIRLFAYIKKYYPEFNQKYLEISVAAKKINKGSKTNEGTIRNTLTALNRLARKFLVIESFMSQEHKVRNAEIFALEAKKLNFKKELDEYFSKFSERNYMVEKHQNESLQLYNLRVGTATYDGRT